MKGGLMYKNRGMACLLALFFYSPMAFSEPSAELKDPTEPTNYSSDVSRARTSESITSFVLDAVLISENNKIAVINNNIVKIGDVIGDEKVKSIDAYSVTLVGEQGEVVLHLFGSPIKEPAK